MYRFARIIGAAVTGVLVVVPAASAADNITPVSFENTVFLPIWIVLFLIAATTALLALSLIRPTEEALPLSLLGFFLAVCNLAAVFVPPGEYMAPQLITNTSILDNVTTTTQQIVVPLAIHSNTLFLLIGLGLFALATLFLFLRVFQYLADTAADAEDELQEMINS